MKSKGSAKWICIIMTAVLLLIGTAWLIITLTKSRYEFPQNIFKQYPSETTIQYKSSPLLEGTIRVYDYGIDLPSDTTTADGMFGPFKISDSSVIYVVNEPSTVDMPAAIGECLELTAPASKENVTLQNEENGTFNGMSYSYAEGKSKNYAFIAYRLNTNEETNVYFIGIVNEPTTDSLATCSNALITLLRSVRDINKVYGDYELDTDEEDEAYDDEYYHKYDDDESLAELAEERDVAIVHKTQQYSRTVYADCDYERMRLTLRWMDVRVTPWSLELVNADGSLSYEPVESEPGCYVYIIDDVKEGDEFTFNFNWPNPGGIDIFQEEEQDYEDYYLNR